MTKFKLLAASVVSAHASKSIQLSYSASMQPLMDISIGNQWLKLVFDASSADTAVFVKEMDACSLSTSCYSYEQSLQKGTVKICAANSNIGCVPGQGSDYVCDPTVLANLSSANAHKESLMIDGLQYNQRGVEGIEEVSLVLNGDDAPMDLSRMPLRLLVQPMSLPSVQRPQDLPMQLFADTSGIIGASGPTLSCRNESIWGELLKRLDVKLIIFDWHAPMQAKKGQIDQVSRVVFDDIDERFHQQLVWSQQKQTGDALNDGMYEFLLYHPSICGIDLLYNTSSNWLVVIDTSGPCLALPSFLFDRLRSRVELDCPFGNGELSLGMLCSPRRGASGTNKLPTLEFALDDAQQPAPPKLTLPLERLVFDDSATGKELLCVSRADDEAVLRQADMLNAHIALGSLAVAAFYVVANLENSTVALASRGDVASESSADTCIDSIRCISPMQTYFPPSNICEDPRCSEYIFMTLDENTKMCVWSSAIPLCFGLLLAALLALDFISHRLYKQAIRKASESRQ
mmetsp:Transcript_49885/g.77982  ORF Transcript_49885/g.77982 Transcript_49885/m.77982 type:complete len:516 (+) Transcript_49885:69-1616(+)